MMEILSGASPPLHYIVLIQFLFKKEAPGVTSFVNLQNFD
jgi:hypothetical protein